METRLYFSIKCFVKENLCSISLTDTRGNDVWSVKLSPVKAGGPYNVTAKSNNVEIVLSNVLFGDVWMCSGQSNMQFTVGMVRR